MGGLPNDVRTHYANSEYKKTVMLVKLLLKESQITTSVSNKHFA